MMIFHKIIHFSQCQGSEDIQMGKKIIASRIKVSPREGGYTDEGICRRMGGAVSGSLRKQAETER